MVLSFNLAQALLTAGPFGAECITYASWASASYVTTVGDRVYGEPDHNDAGGEGSTGKGFMSTVVA